MASVYRKKGVRNYVIAYTDPITGKRREQSARTTNHKAALARAGEIERECEMILSGAVPPLLARAKAANALPLSSHLDAYTEQMKLRGLARKTRVATRSRIDWIAAHAGARRLADLTLESVTAALASLRAQDRSTQTIANYRKAVRGLLAWCSKVGLVTGNPLEHLEAPRIVRVRQRRAIPAEDVEALLRYADTRGRGLFYRLAFLAGLRRGDIARLRWRDVDLERGVLVVREGKAKRVDEVPIHPELRPALEAAAGMPAAHVVPVSPNNRTRRRDFERVGIRAVDERGLHADLHAARMTLHDRLREAGASDLACQRILRHASYETTVRAYTDPERKLAEAVDGMERLGKAADEGQEKAKEVGS